MAKMIRRVDRSGATDVEVEYELTVSDGVTRTKRDWFTTSPGVSEGELEGALIRQEQQLQRLVDLGVNIW